MNVDHYAGAARRWATRAMRVYGPIATELVASSPRPLAGRSVLDAGAGTGAASAALVAVGARPIAADLSRDMLQWNARARPPAVIADIRALPLVSGSVDDVVAAFVLNHLVSPAPALAELVRVARPDGVLLACVFGNDSRSAARDRVDELAAQAGWTVPSWYLDLKAEATPVLGSAAAMSAALSAAGLVDVSSDERPVETGITTASELVSYRFGQAHFSAWLEELGEERGAEVERRIAAAVEALMEPYRPVVVFGSARIP